MFELKAAFLHDKCIPRNRYGFSPQHFLYRCEIRARTRVSFAARMRCAEVADRLRSICARGIARRMLALTALVCA